MIPLPEFKKSLGPTALIMTDKQIEQLREVQDQFAEAVFDTWIKNKNLKLVNSIEKVENTAQK